MAEEVLKYRVEVDQSDLNAQLTNIKNQVDLALGSMSFRSQMDTGGGGGVQNAIANAYTDASGLFSNLGNFISNNISEPVGNFLTQGAEAAQLGYHKFTTGLQTAGLVSPPQFLDQYPLGDIAANSWYPKERGFIGSTLAGKFGMGYDYDMPISQGEYRDINSRVAGRKSLDMGVGLMTGALAFSSLPLAIGTQLGYEGLKLLGQEYDAVENFGSFIEASSFRNIGQLSKDESLDVAKYIRNLGTDPDNRIKIGGSNKITDLITEGVVSGMFLDTANAEEFKQRAEDLVENFRTIQHTMKVTSDEAMKIIGEVSSFGISSEPASIMDFAQRASTLGKSTGYGVEGMYDIALQSAEMVRGTGRSLYDASMSGMAIANQISGGLDDRTYDPNFVRQAGGVDRLTLLTQQLGYDAAVGPYGIASTAANMGGYSPSNMGINSLVGAIQSGIPTGTSQDLFQYSKNLNQNILETSGAMGLFQEYNILRSAASRAGIELKTKDDYKHFLELGGLDPQSAEAKASAVYTDPQNMQEGLYKEKIDSVVNEREETPGDLARGWSSTISALDAGWKDFSYPIGAALKAAGRAGEDFLIDWGISPYMSGRNAENISNLYREATFGENENKGYSKEFDNRVTTFEERMSGENPEGTLTFTDLFPHLSKQRERLKYYQDRLVKLGVDRDIARFIDPESLEKIGSGDLTEIGGVDLTERGGDYDFLRRQINSPSHDRAFDDYAGDSELLMYELSYNNIIKNYNRKKNWQGIMWGGLLNWGNIEKSKREHEQDISKYYADKIGENVLRPSGEEKIDELVKEERITPELAQKLKKSKEATGYFGIIARYGGEVTDKEIKELESLDTKQQISDKFTLTDDEKEDLSEKEKEAKRDDNKEKAKQSIYKMGNEKQNALMIEKISGIFDLMKDKWGYGENKSNRTGISPLIRSPGKPS